MSAVDLARPELRALTPYSAAEQVQDTIRLNANEAPWSSESDRYRRPLNRYPEVRPEKLRHALAARFRVAPEQMLVTRGTSEAIDLLIRTFCRAGKDEILIVEPTFSMYRHYATIQGAGVRSVTADPGTDFSVDSNTVLAACGDATKLVFLCSPNNPTGTSIPPATFEAVLAGRRDKSVVVVDEAYVEFAGTPSRVAVLANYDNLIVLRTLSKALAFAGARCGTVIGATPVIDMLNAVQAPYALATPVVECAEDALSEHWLAEAGQRVAETVAEREALRGELDSLDLVLKVWPSDANFLLVKVKDVHAVMQATREAGILLRHFGGSLDTCVRISIGTAAENAALLAVLKRIDGRAT